jgi:uncharacterized protein YukE
MEHAKRERNSMGDVPPANPDDLKLAATRFFGVAEELQRIHDVLTNRTQDLVSGADAWSGSGSEQFQAAWERFGDDSANAAVTLQRAANILNLLATEVGDVQSSSAGKLVHAIDSGQVTVVPNQVRILIPGSAVHASEAASAYTVVRDAYSQAAANAANGFDSAAHAPTRYAHLAGGVSSTAVGVSQTGWSTATQATAGESATAAGYTQTAPGNGKRANAGEKSDGAEPVAPGIFTLAAGGDDAGAGAAGSNTYAQASTSGESEYAGAYNGGSGGGNAKGNASAATATRGGATNAQIKTRIYTRADLGGSPSDAALAAARSQASEPAQAWS